MDRLLGDPEFGRDLRPGPAEIARSIDVQGLQLLGQSAQGSNRPETDGGIAAAGAGSQIG